MKKSIILIVLQLIFIFNINAQIYSVYDETHEYLHDLINFMVFFELGNDYNYFNNLNELNESSIAHELKVPICEYENHLIYQEMLYSTDLNTYYSKYFLLYNNNILEKIICPIRLSYDRYIYLSRYSFDVIYENNYYVILQPKIEDSNISLIKIYKYYYINNSFDESSNATVLCVYRK
jgi:hypothetical protein